MHIGSFVTVGRGHRSGAMIRARSAKDAPIYGGIARHPRRAGSGWRRKCVQARLARQAEESPAAFTALLTKVMPSPARQAPGPEHRHTPGSQYHLLL